MNTPMTYDQAIALLRKQPATYDTPDKLRALAAQVDADATGQTTVLYSGTSAKGVSSSNIIKSMLEAGEDIRVIDNSDAARLLPASSAPWPATKSSFATTSNKKGIRYVFRKRIHPA